MRVSFFPLVLLFLTLSVVACNEQQQQCPVEVQLISDNNYFPTHPDFRKYDIYFGVHTLIRMTAVVDTVTITGVITNRGNANTTEYKKYRYVPLGEVPYTIDPLPKTLKFGDKYDVSTQAGLNTIKEVQVQTDQGAWTFTF